MGVKDKLKNVWNQSDYKQVSDINKEIKSRANKAPWYKAPTGEDLIQAYKTRSSNQKSKKNK